MIWMAMPTVLRLLPSVLILVLCSMLLLRCRYMETILVMIGGMTTVAHIALGPVWRSMFQGGPPSQPMQAFIWVVNGGWVVTQLIFLTGVFLLIRRHLRLLRGETDAWVPPVEEGSDL